MARSSLDHVKASGCRELASDSPVTLLSPAGSEVTQGPDEIDDQAMPDPEEAGDDVGRGRGALRAKGRSSAGSWMTPWAGSHVFGSMRPLERGSGMFSRFGRCSVPTGPAGGADGAASAQQNAASGPTSAARAASGTRCMAEIRARDGCGPRWPFRR
jgi:hypothetical protein